jgi:transcriptional regulator with XRE-family HTH domain
MVAPGLMPQSKASSAPAAALALPALERAALFFDVDGTLLDIRPEPRDVVSDGDLRALLERHHLTPAEIERRTAVGERPPVSAVTVRRILKAEARTEPEPATLRRIAEAVGESYTATFAETPDSQTGSVGGSTPSPSLTIDVSPRGGRYFLRFLGGEAPAGLEAELRAVLDRYEQPDKAAERAPERFADRVNGLDKKVVARR